MVVLHQHDPAEYDLVMLGAGVDVHTGNAGLKGMDYSLLAEREATVLSWALGKVPIAFTLLGGYLGDEIAREDFVRLHR